MTIEEIEDLVRQLTAVADKLEARAAKQSIQEAFLQAHAYADEYRYLRLKDRSGNDRLAHDLFRSNMDILAPPRESGPLP